MPAPVDVDMSSVSGLWPAFVISGVTGTGAASLNGQYNRVPDFLFGTDTVIGRWVAASGAVVYLKDEITEEWGLDLSAVEQFAGFGATPWEVASWSDTGPASGSPVFTRALAPPVTVEFDGAEAALQATLTTALTGTNNDLTYTAALGGRLGNGWRIRYLNPAANNQAIAVTVDGQDVTVSLATNGSGVITSTAEQVETALNLVEAFAVPLIVNIPAANDGSGVVTAMAFTALSGGTGGLPPAPVEVTI